MMPLNVVYYKPTRLEDAVSIFNKLANERKKPAYIAGGTEIITLSRFNQEDAEGLIDITHLSECHAFDFQDSQFIIGACVTLNQIAEDNRFPLLGVTGNRVADHTARNQITLGGNISGKIIYKEALLPLLVSESTLLIASVKGLRTEPIMDIFHEKLQLDHGEMIVQINTNSEMLTQPFYSVKKRKIDVIDYPLLTLVAVKIENTIRVAITGLCDFPFRSRKMEAIFNNKELPIEIRIEEAIGSVPGRIRDDWIASSEYRLFVFKNTLQEMFTALEGESL